MKEKKQSQNNKKGKWIGARFDDKMLEQFEVIMSSYRASNASHAIRLLVEDKYHNLIPRGFENGQSTS